MNNKLYAAVDLGSVSFHLVIMTRKEGRLVWVDCKKELVRMGSGLDAATGQLNKETTNRVLSALRRFSRTLSSMKLAGIRVVGTSTFRRLNDANLLMKQAEEILGYPIEILSGDREAEYIYRGVSHNLADERRFVIDIGGGSTELIVGQGTQLSYCASLEIGCITLTQQYFDKPDISSGAFIQAEQAAAEAIRPVAHLFSMHDWESELGTSGSIKAISWAMQHLDISDGEISKESIADMREIIMATSSHSALATKIGLNRRRTSVFCGGFAILSQAFRLLNLGYIRVAQGAIREGIIDEMADSIEEENRVTTLQ